MKKRLLASILSLAMVFSLVPVSALAEDEEPGGDSAPVCTCEARCTGETVDETCPVCAEDITLCAFEEAPADEGKPTPCTVTEGCTLEAGHEGECVLPGEPEEPAGPTAEEQLAELIAALPDPADIDPEDEAQVEEVYNQISAIYAFAEENGLDVEENETINAVIAALYPVEALASSQTISTNTTWSQETTLSNDLIINSGVTLTIGAKVTISGDVTISGGGTIKRGNDYKDELLSVPLGAELTLQNITIDGGAIWNGDTTSGLTAEESAIRIEGGEVTLDSGAVVQNNNHISVRDNPYIHSGTRYYNMGGGIAVYGGTLTMNNGAQIKNNAVTNTDYEKKNEGNSDSHGGGVAVYENGTFIMNGGEISGNRAVVSNSEGRAFGGGVSLLTRGANRESPSTLDNYKIAFTMNGGTISGNRVNDAGAGVYGCVDQGDEAAARKNHLEMHIAGKIAKNASTKSGGGVQVGSADLKIENGAEIVSNVANSSGGGIQIGSNSSFIMRGGLVSDNTAERMGGGIYFNCNPGGELGITGGTISNNTAREMGGGIQIGTGLTVSLADCAIIGNTANKNGGGIQANPGVALTLTDCTVTKNASKDGNGGGLYVSGPHKNNGGSTTFSGTVTIDNNTSFLNGSNAYINGIDAVTTFDNLNENSKIGMAWNANNVASEGTPVVINATENTYPCIVFESKGRFVLRRDPENNTAVLHPALYVTLKENYPGNSGPYEGERWFEALGIAGDTVDFTQVCGFELRGHHIDRWAKNRVGQEGYTWTNPYTFPSAKDPNIGTANAIWEPNVYTVTYELNGGTINKDAPATHTYNTNTTLVAPTRENYIFAGWFTNSDFSGTKITSLGATDYTADITLYAQWTKKIGTNTNYTVNAIVDQTYTGAAIEPAVVVKDGDTVLSSGYTVTYSNNTNVGTAKVTVAIGADTAEVEFMIVKDENPTVEMSDKSITYGDACTMTATAQTSAGNEITGGAITIKYYTNETCSEGESETAPTNAGTYYAKATLTGTDNYAEASKVAKITISNATFSVTATGYSGTYDGTAHSIIVTADGADVTYSTDGTTYSSTNPTFTNAGTYTVYYKAEKANHDDVTGFVSVEITKALLTITADNQTVYVGGTLPEYTYTVSGLVGNDTEAVITTKPTMTCSAQDANTAGTYDITASSADAGNNYTIKYVDGTLTIADTGDGNAFKVETSALTSVPSSLSNLYETVTDLTTALKTEIRNANSSVSNSNIVVYDVTLMVNENGKWVKADKEHFPANGKLTVTLPYPDGTNSSYTFTVVHMFTTSDFDKTPGKTENPTVRNTANGIQFEVTGLSPISVGWTAPRSTGGGGGGSSSYNVSVDSGRNGSVSVSPKSAKKGDTVTITVKPDKGYEVDEIIVTDSKGNELKLTKKSDTRYTFTMPSGKVTVEASFAKIADAPDKDLAFVDVPANAYYADAVAWAVENGITSGTSDTTFSPNAACTRAQMMTFLWRAAGSPKAAGNNPFTDLDASAYYYDAVLWAVSEGITSGTSATTFSPDATVTRGQTVTFLYRANGSPTSSGNSFADVAHDAYYANAVAWAVSEGITSGTGNNAFSPDADCTRAQIVTFMYRNMA